MAEPPLRCARLLPYRLPLLAPWVTPRGRWVGRCGLLLRLEDAAGVAGYGDCAPWPEFGTETSMVARRQLEQFILGCAGRQVADLLALVDYLGGQWRETPAARNAVETAVLDLAAKRAGVPLARLLDPDAATSVAVSARLGAMDEGLEARAMAAVRQGFSVLKVKITVEPGDAIERLENLAARLEPGIRLRLDANGMWDGETAVRVLTALNKLPVESLEEPLNACSPEMLARLQGLVDFPIALDESLSGRNAENLLERCPVRRLVLKPIAHGGPLRCLALARKAYGEGKEAVITSAIESAVGTRGALHLAAALPGAGVHGLVTDNWLAGDVGEPLDARAGHMHIGGVAGLGYCPEEELENAFLGDFSEQTPWVPAAVAG